MPGRTQKRAQIGFDEEPLENPELLGVLERRARAQKRKEMEAQPIVDEYNGLHKQARAIVEQMELEPGTYRCGEWIVTVSEQESREVEFTRNSSRSIRFKPART